MYVMQNTVLLLQFEQFLKQKVSLGKLIKITFSWFYNLVEKKRTSHKKKKRRRKILFDGEKDYNPSWCGGKKSDVTLGKRCLQ